MTRGLEGRCSIHLSYGRRIRQSGRSDLNRGPPAPKAGALPNCATPRREQEILTDRQSRVNPKTSVMSSLMGAHEVSHRCHEGIITPSARKARAR